MTARKIPRTIKPRTSDAGAILDRMDAGDTALAHMIAAETTTAAIARQIYTLRTRHHLTQAQLAERVGTKQPVIARLEDADYQGHSLGMLSRIADALGYTVTVRFVPRRKVA
jgi:predicted XRE-type DNA-binding protein